jgi:hypothetical protein
MTENGGGGAEEGLHAWAKPAQNVVDIVTCRLVQVTKLTGSSLDDWIYWHFSYGLS